MSKRSAIRTEGDSNEEDRERFDGTRHSRRPVRRTAMPMAPRITHDVADRKARDERASERRKGGERRVSMFLGRGARTLVGSLLICRPGLARPLRNLFCAATASPLS